MAKVKRKRASWAEKIQAIVDACETREELEAALSLGPPLPAAMGSWTVSDAIDGLEIIWRQKGWKGWPDRPKAARARAAIL
jgi:hypothetical protein